MGLVYFFQTNYLDEFYKTSKIKTIEKVADSIAESVQAGSLNDALDKLSFTNEVCVRISSNVEDYNVNGACILREISDSTVNQIGNEVNKNGGKKLFDNFVYNYGHGDEADSMKMFVYGETFKIDKANILIMVSSLITPLNATISTIKRQYVLIAAIVVAATIILALIMSRLIIRPIKKINDESNNLSKGNYNGGDIKTRNKEFSELNKTLIKANEDIQKADKAKKELVANVSHDLRTPLTMIVGYGEMIRDLPEENNEDNINVIIDEAKRLSSLVDDLLDISRIDEGKITLNKKEINLYTLLHDVYKQYSNYCKAKKVKFKLKVDKEYRKIKVEVDEKRIKQVIYNFINNALNYNDKDNCYIELGAELVNDKVRIYVYDNGQGIKESELNSVWDRYYKSSSNHIRHHIGSGIGLSLSRDLLEAHELEHGVDSKINEYSKFYFDVKQKSA